MEPRHLTYCRTASRFGLAAILIGCGLSITSCYPGDELTPTDTDIVATFFDPAANFSTKLTYAMPDSVAHVEGDVVVSTVGPYDQQILSRIRTNMDQLGFTRVANPSQADVLVASFATETTWVSGGCYSSYWGWWYPYPGYCYPVVYTYETGTLVTVMVNRNETTEKPALWVAGINGLTTGASSADITARINRNIDQAFTQSPYLGAGK